MHILAICGSPREGGNTDSLLDAVLEGARSSGASAEKIILNKLSFKPCQACGGCDKTAACVIKDDLTGVYKKIEDADVLVVGSPIFFGGISAQTKMMIDRFQPYWVAKNVLKRPAAKPRKGVLICTSAALKKEFFDNAKYVVKLFFNTLGVEYFRDMFCGGMEEKGIVKNNKELLDSAFKIGELIGKAH